MIAGAACLAGGIGWMYRPLLGAYLWDDDFGWLSEASGFQLWKAFDPSTHNMFFRPVVETYFAAAMRLLGYSPPLFHAANIVLHLCNVALVFVVARQLWQWRQPTAVGGDHASRRDGHVRPRDGWTEAMPLLAACCFGTLPAAVHAVAWVSGMSALVMTLFYLLALACFNRYLADRDARAYLGTLVSFALALLTHEGAVTLLPVMVVFHLLVPVARRQQHGPRRLAFLARTYVPLALIYGAFLVISYGVNQRNYVVTEGHYQFGTHVFANVFDYLASLYVGHRDAVTNVVVSAALLAAFALGNRPMRAALLWTFAALAPYSFFTWGNQGRYLYLPAAAFSVFVALAAGQLAFGAGRLKHSTAVRGALLLAVVLAFGRFAAFTVKTARAAGRAGEPYKVWYQTFRRDHPSLPPGARVTIPSPSDPAVKERALQPLLQLEYGDQEIRLAVETSRRP